MINKLLLTLTLTSGLIFGQTASVPVSTPIAPPPAVDTNVGGNFQPAYYIGTGASYDYYGKSGAAAETELGIRIGSTNLYSYTTIELGTTQATIRTGAAYLFYQTGNWSLLALGDAGLATSSVAPVLGSFSAGGMGLFDIGNKLSKGTQHFYIGTGMRFITVTGLGSQPVAVVTFGKGF